MTARETHIADVPHIGPVSAGWLEAAGVCTFGDLEDLGALGAYEAVRATQSRASLNLLYGLAGALRGVAWTEVDVRERVELRAMARGLEVGR